MVAGALLRSGNLKAYTALGAVGRPVYSAASQLRAAIRRLPGEDGKALANLLAIPKQSEDGDSVDWYAPEPGSVVVPWSAATADEQHAAKATLQAARARLEARSAELQASEDNAERQVFGKLLAQAIEFPGDEHVYLVDGKPVITFWGFRDREAPPGFDAIAGLDTSGGAARPPGAPPGQAAAPIAAGEAAVTAAEAPVVVDGRRRWWWWLLPLLLLPLLLLLLIGLKSCGVEVPFASRLPELPFLAKELKEPPATGEAGRTLEGGRVIDERARDGTTVIDRDGRTVIDRDGVPSGGVPGDQTGPAAGEGPQPPLAPAAKPAEQAEQRPDQPAALPPEKKPEDAKPGEQKPDAEKPDAQKGEADRQRDAGVPPPPVVPPGVTPPLPPGAVPADAPRGTPLAIPEGALKEGRTDFLHGAWRSITGLQDRSGNPIELNYDFQNGQGRVSLQRGVGGQRQTCAGQAGSAVEGGKLIINQQGIRCPDGTAFQDSKVQCSVGPDGRARCQGLNEDGSAYDVSIVK